MASLITSDNRVVNKVVNNSGNVGRQTTYQQESQSDIHKLYTPDYHTQETHQPQDVYMQDNIQPDSQSTQLHHHVDTCTIQHTQHTNQLTTSANQQTLSETVEQVVRQYFAQLEGDLPTQLYDLILTQVEKPLLSVVLEFANGNQSKSADILGLNRGTLRKKLKAHGLLDGK